MTSRFQPRAAYRALRAYDVVPSSCEIELSDNTSPFGPPPTALQVVRAATSQDASQYPTTYSRPLREVLARHIGVSPDEIMVGAGSDEVMSAAFRALGDPGARVAYMDPTFVMARVFAASNSLDPVPVPLTATYDADADALLATRADITYLCTPNNPTGTNVTTATLDRVVREARGVVMVDEAYAEFAGTNIAATAPGRDGLLVLRTFSKAFGLAGLRVGFAVGARALIAELEKARGPFSVTAASERAAQAAIEHDVPWVMERVSELCKVRDWFAAALRDVGHAPLPSAANFVLVPVADAVAAHAALRARGILVRHFAELAGIGGALRISMAPRPVMERVLDAMREAVPCA
ncbi:MAG: histidinol-phosphate aminotransferase family protein [Cytophagaceae bacterium]|nr:histidinol-phosphate aminotransferase family protein [Gemmatimonadaceae bacterium]